VGGAGYSYTQFYLSADTVWDSGDAYLGYDYVGDLGAGLSETATLNLSAPANLAAGTYYVLARADANGYIGEASETNNTRARQITLRVPDLVISALSTVKAAYGPGEAVVVTATTANTGVGDAVGSYTSFYLSRDAMLDAADTYLGYDYVSPLATGLSESDTDTVYLPDDLALGTYYLIAAADGDRELSEASEANNSRAVQLTVGAPDLIVSALTTDKTVYSAGETVKITATTKNAGVGGAGYSYTQFYLSADTVWDSGDAYLGYDYVGDLGAGLSETAAVTVQLSSSLPAGVYRVIGFADASNRIVEVNEANNFSFSDRPTLGIDAVSADKAEGNNGWRAFTFSITRSGNTGIASSVRYRVSGGTADEIDFVGGAFPSGSVYFAPGVTSAKAVSIKIAGDSTKEADESFTVTLFSPSGGSIGKDSATGSIRNEDPLPALRRKDDIFAEDGGAHAVLARFAKAAYSLQSWENVKINDVSANADAARASIFSDWRPLPFTMTESTSTEEGVAGVKNRCAGGFYTYGNSAALVARCKDALVVTFRGTNDNGSTNFDDPGNNIAPDKADWYGALSNKADHYANLQPLITAIDSYVADPVNGITKVYVTGHSLGGAMARAFMNDHSGSMYEAITFAAPPFGVIELADGRITRVEVAGDIVPDTGFAGGPHLHFKGEDHTVLDAWPASSVLHSMDNYRAIMQGVTADEWGQLTRIAGDSTLTVLFGGDVLAPTSTSLASANGGQLSGDVDHFYALNGNDDVDNINTPLDVVIGGVGNDTLRGGVVGEFLLGGGGADELIGRAGQDTLVGGAGADTLAGGTGVDRFKFVTTADAVDSLADFASGTDRILVVSKNFGGLNLGALDASRFVAAGAALPAVAAFVYDASTGSLSFDADGSGSASAAVQIAALTGPKALVAGDVQVVAA
jgi:Ca2+-binding RTX toxin-like protein